MRPAETVRRDCSNCVIEFEVTLEPKAAGQRQVIADLLDEWGEEPVVRFCPFCGNPVEEES